MQDFGAIPGLARRVLGAAAGGSGERLRRYSPPASGHPQAPVKCPRCDSTNTKFCYYNNYNLAQPRHFCKACRRYWTKGGVLRNVPVGGGCRKSKRSASSSSSSSSRPSVAAHKDLPRRPSNVARSGSGNSSTLAAAEVSSSASFPVSILVTPQPDPNPDSAASFDPAIGMEDPLVHTVEIFADTSTAAATGIFTSLIPPAAAPAMLVFNSLPDSLPAPLALPLQPNTTEEIGAQQGFANQACAGAGTGCGLAGIDWPGSSVDPVLFDLAAAVDPAAAYWSHGHWGDGDPALYLP